MTCLHGKNIVICVPSTDAWRRFFARCPVCKTRRLCLAEFQDYYGDRCTCLTCGTGWMEGEYKPAPKRERAEIAAKAKARVRAYIDTGIEQGYGRFFQRLEHERVLRMICSGRLLTTGE